MMPSNISIQQIYEVTGTPEVDFKDLTEGIASSIKYVQCDPKYDPPHHALIDDIVRLCLSTMHVQKDRRYISTQQYSPGTLGLLHIREPLLHVIISACDETGMDAEQRSFIKSIIENWYLYLDRHALPLDRLHFSMQPKVEDPPLISLFSKAWANSVTPKSSHRSFFYSYFYPIYKAIRHLERSDITVSTFYDYLRALRAFFKYVPDWIKTMENHPIDMPLYYVDAAVARIPLARETSLMREVYKQKIVTALSGDKVFGRTINDRAQSSEFEMEFVPPDGHVIIFDNPNGKPNFPKDVLFDDIKDDDMDQSPMKEIKFPDSAAYIKLNAKDNVVPYKPSLHGQWRDHIAWRTFQLPFDSSYLNSFHFSVIYHLFALAWSMSSYFRAILAFLFMAIHTGISSARLINMKREIDPNALIDEDGLALLKQGGQYYIKAPALIEIKTAVHRADFKSWSEHVYIPLPTAIGEIIDRLPVADYVFSYTPEGAREKNIRLELSDIDRVLNRTINNQRGICGYPLRVTRSKISGSFLAFYKQHGLDPVNCCHIAGRDYQHSFKSMAQYRNIPQTFFEESYLNAFELAHNHILSNLRECYKLGFLTEPASGFSWVEFHEPPRESPSPFASLAHGSAFTPTRSFARDHFSKLISAITDSKDLIECYNRYVIYAYHGLQMTDGLRPRNNPSIDISHIDVKFKSIKISDKHSRRRREERVVILQDTVSKVILNLRQGFKHLQLQLAKSGDNRLLTYNPSSLFFFVNANGIDEFTLTNMRSHLVSASLDPVFSTNLMRHYLITHLFTDEKICNAMISAIVGHQRAGQELHSIFSSAVASLALRDALKAIDAMLLDLGYALIDFPEMKD